MKEDQNAYRIVQKMLENDRFSQWMGIQLLHLESGQCTIRMNVREEMLNGFSILHGGITYAFADSAFAFASNSMGKKAVSLQTSINHTVAVFPQDTLTATAVCEHGSRRTGIFKVEVHNQDEKLVALFTGTVYIKEEEWSV